jgi:hypothetical protein
VDKVSNATTVSINSYNLMHNTKDKLECNFENKGRRLVMLRGLPR